MSEQTTILLLSQLHESPSNPRLTFDEPAVSVAQWRPMSTAPRHAPVLLLVPTRWAKGATHIAAQGRWMNVYWVMFNADEAVQRVEPEGWQPLAAPAVPVALTPEQMDAAVKDYGPQDDGEDLGWMRPLAACGSGPT